MRLRVLRILCCVVSAIGLLLVASAPAAVAVEQGQFGQFGITKFTMEPTERTTVKEVPFIFGLGYEFVYEPYKTPFTQAGAHPWALTTVGEVTTEEFEVKDVKERQVVPTQDPKDFVTNLPPGLLGDPMAVPRCPLSQVTSGAGLAGFCPADTQVGVYVVRLGGGVRLLGPIVNVTPEAGQSAEFALENTVKAVTPE